eukprot:3559374-Pleurochrysis_carterae.AAC.1
MSASTIYHFASVQVSIRAELACTLNILHIAAGIVSMCQGVCANGLHRSLFSSSLYGRHSTLRGNTRKYVGKISVIDGYVS